jgi:hypothetical protein
MEIARDPYSMALLGLIYAKKRRQKSHAWAPLSQELKKRGLPKKICLTHSRFQIRVYLSEFRVLCENTLGCETGAKGEIFHGRTKVKKFPDSVPFQVLLQGKLTCLLHGKSRKEYSATELAPLSLASGQSLTSTDF